MAKTDFSIAEIAALRLKCQAMELEGREILEKYTDEELSKIFNGIGPDAFPAWLRALISWLHDSLLCVALIHDVQWYERSLRKNVPGAEDRAEFAASNAMFKLNGYRAAKYDYSVLNPARYKVEFDAWRFSVLCGTEFGWLAWKN